MILCCGTIGPKLLRIDLKTEAKKEEKTLGIRRNKLGITSGWQPIGLRAYKVPVGAPIVGRTVEAAEKSVTDGRLFIERIRRGAQILVASGEQLSKKGRDGSGAGPDRVACRSARPEVSRMRRS